MCVAIYKPKDVKTPPLETLEHCWNTNPDGAGFALLTGGEKYAIEIHKGYMTWQEFTDAYEKYHLAGFTGELLLHFRIATHGGISQGLTHPFSLTKDVKLLKHTHVNTNYALIHNGMLPIEPRDNGISDTVELCRRLAPLYQNIPAALDLMQGMVDDNKIAVMTRDKVHLFGEWDNVDGVYFSNMRWDWHYDYDDFGYEHAAADDDDDGDDNLWLLKQGYCPDCGGSGVTQDKLTSEYFCCECGFLSVYDTNNTDNAASKCLRRY